MHLAMENDKINKKKLYLKTRSARWYMTIYRPSEPSFFAGVDDYASFNKICQECLQTVPHVLFRNIQTWW